MEIIGGGLRLDRRFICMRFVHNYFRFSLYLFFHTNTSFPSAIFVEYLTVVERSLGIIGKESLSMKETMRNIRGGG